MAEGISAETVGGAEAEGTGRGSEDDTPELAGSLVTTGAECGGSEGAWEVSAVGGRLVGGATCAELGEPADLLLAGATQGLRLRITRSEMQASAATVPLMTATSFKRLIAASGKGGGISCVVRLTELTEEETPSAPSRGRSGAVGCGSGPGIDPKGTRGIAAIPCPPLATLGFEPTELGTTISGIDRAVALGHSPEGAPTPLGAAEGS